MLYILSGVIIVLCTVVIIFGLRIYKENNDYKKELMKKYKDRDKVTFN